MKKWSFEEVKKCGFLIEIEEEKFIISFELDLFQETDAGHLMTSFIKGQCQYSTSLMKETIFQSGQTETPPSIPEVKEGSFEDLFEMILFDKNLKEFTSATIGEPVVVQGPVHFSACIILSYHHRKCAYFAPRCGNLKMAFESASVQAFFRPLGGQLVVQKWQKRILWARYGYWV